VNGDDPAGEIGWSSDLLRIKRENGGMPMDLCPASFADLAHISIAGLELSVCFEKSPRRG
jgi:hypothetical protein